jgi:thioredoxin-like negative regulator of GroEL
VINISDNVELVISNLKKYKECIDQENFEDAINKIEYVKDKCSDCEQYKIQYIDALLKTKKISKARKEMDVNKIEDVYMRALIEFYDQNNDKAKQILNSSYDHSEKTENLK